VLGRLGRMLGGGRALRGTAYHLQPALVRVLALRAEEVQVVLELQLEHPVLLYAVGGAGRRDGVAQQW